MTYDLWFDIYYNLKEDSFRQSGNVSLAGQIEIVEGFLRSQMGRGEDKSPPYRRDEYRIGFKVNLGYDDVRVSDNTGNKGLRCGLLISYLGRLREA